LNITCRSLPNQGVIETQLSAADIKNFWNAIEDAKQMKNSIKSELAGHIHSSLKLDIFSPHLSNFVKVIMPALTNKYIETFNGIPVEYHSTDIPKYELGIDRLWVNFQKQHEFNPIHNHGGVFSFVIWMKIPTSTSEQANLTIAKTTSSKGLISNFVFIYSDILGKIRSFAYQLEKDISGYVVMFPSSLNHQVYPFYESESNRISVSGNIALRQVL